MASFLYCERKKAASLFIEIRKEITLKSIKKTDYIKAQLPKCSIPVYTVKKRLY
jgi:hypothetical protein